MLSRDEARTFPLVSHKRLDYSLNNKSQCHDYFYRTTREAKPREKLWFLANAVPTAEAPRDDLRTRTIVVATEE